MKFFRLLRVLHNYVSKVDSTPTFRKDKSPQRRAPTPTHSTPKPNSIGIPDTVGFRLRDCHQNQLPNHCDLETGWMKSTTIITGPRCVPNHHQKPLNLDKTCRKSPIKGSNAARWGSPRHVTEHHLLRSRAVNPRVAARGIYLPS